MAAALLPAQQLALTESYGDEAVVLTASLLRNAAGVGRGVFPRTCSS